VQDAQPKSGQSIGSPTLFDASLPNTEAFPVVLGGGTNNLVITSVGTAGLTPTTEPTTFVITDPLQHTVTVDIAAVTEDADGTPGENVENHELVGSVATVAATSVVVQPQGNSYLGTFEAQIQPDGSVKWTFKVNDGAIDFLQQGEQIIQTYTVTVTETGGGTATRIVIVTVNGSEDAPILTSQDPTEHIKEIADG